MSYAELASQVQMRAEILRGQGVDAASLVCPETVEDLAFCIEVLALLSLGATVEPIPCGDSEAARAVDLPASEVNQDRSLVAAEAHDASSRGDSIKESRIRTSTESDCGPTWFRELLINGGGRLLFRTSGTSGAAKRILLTAKQVYDATQNIRQAFELSQNDICLNWMPLHHTHGLITATLSTWSSGGSVVFASTASPAEILDIYSETLPTWITAVPTKYAALFALYRNPERDLSYLGTLNSRLRFVRTASAPAGSVLEDRLERIFCRPVLNTYGLTETSSLISCSPIGKGRRGSLGVPVGAEIRVVREDGTQADPNEDGEIIVRGACVSRSVPEATGLAPTLGKGWIRTSDRGHLDDDGYIFVTGRLTDLIKRGGVLVDLQKIDNALIATGLVQEAASFPVPHPTLGHDVVSAVVAGSSRQLDPGGLRRLLLASNPRSEVPSRIVFVDQIPKSRSGKVARQNLADELAEFLRGRVSSSSDVLHMLTAAFQIHFPSEVVDEESNFFSIGGDSLQAVAFAAYLTSLMRREVSPEDIFVEPTPKGLSILLGSRPVKDGQR
ncbi:non-ribosomal peptide synthetase [Roseomonas mucosa]|uniref:non-ribosomal peptide synthetase n=1 Tax=Roseomonas mucosa TaxID=207340 RepID=UPI0028CCA382|nr:non-ribosomal peptide synthetase [Roseomonas mucosa]MDT8277830.1 non-ribosomal peptide synthetase [Roseomonas mucosa]